MSESSRTACAWVTAHVGVLLLFAAPNVQARGLSFGGPALSIYVNPDSCMVIGGVWGCGSYDVTFHSLYQVEGSSDVSQYELRITPELMDLEGEGLDIDRDGIDGESADDTYVYAFSIALQLPEICTGGAVLDEIDLGDLALPTDLFGPSLPLPRMTVPLIR